MPSDTWFGSWAACFSFSLWSAHSNLRRTILRTSLQMMQQWTGVNSSSSTRFLSWLRPMPSAALSSSR
jgi:myosin-crossreactive antigen